MKVYKSISLAFALFVASSVTMAAVASGTSDAGKGSATGKESAATQSGGILVGLDAAAFPKADKNNDGFIERTEASEVKGLDFAKADANGDGKISWSEFEEAMVKGAVKAPSRAARK